LQEEFDDGKELLVTVVSAMGEEHALACKYRMPWLRISTKSLLDP
jgi:hypothetical protein